MILRNQIIDATFQVGERLPSEGVIAEKFDVSRITAKRALNELAKEGLVTRARGKGTIVADKAAGYLRANFSGLVDDLIEISTNTTVQVLRFEYVTASKHVQKALDLPNNSIVQRAERIRHQGQTPFSHIVTFIPEDVGRSFGPDDLSNRAILHLIEKSGVEINEAVQEISAVLADDDIASHLKMPVASPLLKIARVVSDNDGRPVQYIEILYRQDRHHINMRLKRIVGDDNTRIWKSQNPSAVD